MISNVVNILLADDDHDDCLLFNDALTEMQLPTHLNIVHDGEQLMKLLTKPEVTLPHLLFLDLNMPRRNGFECLKEIKQNEKLKHIPVIIFTTSFHPEVAESLKKNGAQLYIRKPVDFEELKIVLRKVLSQMRIQQQNNQASFFNSTTIHNFVITGL